MGNHKYSNTQKKIKKNLEQSIVVETSKQREEVHIRCSARERERARDRDRQTDRETEREMFK